MADTDVDSQRAALQSWIRRHHPDDVVSYSETHVSLLALGRERVWKLKKAVTYPFVDLSTRERRGRQCEREVVLNRRLAPDVYLGVVDLADDSGQVVDHLVEMRRMPDDRRLAALAEHGAESSACLDRLADELARFHRAAPTGGAIDEHASRDAVNELWEDNIAELAPRAGSIIERADIERVALLARRYLQGRARLFEERIAAGRVRDGHGDLLADDIFCLRAGPRVLDCLEFDDHLRWGDVLADVAFLAMDLERLGRLDLARHFLDRYAVIAGDQWPGSLEHLYVAYRAVVRAKVAWLRADDGVDGAADSARRLLALAREHLERGQVRLVLIGGPPATGKTTLADALVRRLHWPVFHSDEVRKELAGVAPTTRARTALDTGIYGPEWDERTYAALLDRARGHLEHGRSVVLDASWSDPAQRAVALRLAASTSSEIVAFRCAVPREVAAARAAERASQWTDASDAAGEIATRLAARFAGWPEARVVETTSTPEVVVAAVLAALGSAFD
jgi:aminoglycoside phosphotransferase family enzyme/predicted kinase